MPFHSILFDVPLGPEDEAQVMPDSFSDLHLNQVFDAIVTGREYYDLRPLLCRPLHRLRSVQYRQEIFRDLEQPRVSKAIKEFAKSLSTMRSYLAYSEGARYSKQAQRYVLDAAQTYCEAVVRLGADLVETELHAEGWRQFREFLEDYSRSAAFVALREVTHNLASALSSVRYNLRIEGRRIEVRPFSGEENYSEDVERAFEKFRHGPSGNYRFSFIDYPQMNHVEAALLDRVALLFPAPFLELEEYHRENRAFLSPVLRVFDREVQFYLAYLEYLERFRSVGLPVCYPVLSSQSKELHCRETFDIALADTLLAESRSIVTNDFHFIPPERVFVVSGANQGGKTTFARTLGQLHYLASIGCPVPGRDAQLFLYDRLFVHFEREEQLVTLTGKLEEELQRMHYILERLSASSLLIMNESFSSTSLHDALLISRSIMRQILERGAVCVAVTFLEELATLSPATVSLVSDVDPAHPERRTFKIVRRAPSGRAYALAIAERYGLTYGRIKERLRS